VDLAEGICAACGKPLGPRAEWYTAPSGRAYHHGCEPSPAAEAAEEDQESLTKHAERAARRVIHGPGQQSLDDEGDS
jgi:hypothetical protein